VLRSDKSILAVGTTVTRTVEHFARTEELSGECDLFLNPANKPLRVNHLLTNFHLPKSTLIMLVAAFVGREKTLEIYHEAIENEYRFFSYGDAMLIL
ncbi:MAG: S-adenosylmethionine:tRNA ribosyltransferase-isomerase, partial [bacterium]